MRVTKFISGIGYWLDPQELLTEIRLDTRYTLFTKVMSCSTWTVCHAMKNDSRLLKIYAYIMYIRYKLKRFACPYGVVVARLTCTHLHCDEKVPSSILGRGKFL